MKYVANPVEVDAFEILAVKFVKGQEGAYLELDNGLSKIALPEMMARMTPKPGDYWVVQSDGYVYLNPKEVFERKYSMKKEIVEAA